MPFIVSLNSTSITLMIIRGQKERYQFITFSVHLVIVKTTIQSDSAQTQKHLALVGRVLV